VGFLSISTKSALVRVVEWVECVGFDDSGVDDSGVDGSDDADCADEIESVDMGWLHCS